MNIFASDQSPEQAACNLDDKRVVKMIVESAQILSTVLFYYTGSSPYLPVFQHHPCVLWTQQSLANYQWLYRHFIALLQEYTWRYQRQHSCERLIESLQPHDFLPIKSFSSFADCTGTRVQAFLSGQELPKTSNLINGLRPTENYWQKQLQPYRRPSLSIIERYQLCLLLKWRYDKRAVSWQHRPLPNFLITL